MYMENAFVNMEIMAPGCFGIPSVFSPKTSWCLGCAWFEACDKRVNEELSAAQVRIDKPTKVQLTPEQVKLVESVPAGVGKELRLLFQRGMDVYINRAISDSDYDLVGVKANRSTLRALEILILGGFSKKELQCAFVNSLGWSERSAWSQVSLVWKLLIALGVAIEFGDKLIVTPKLQCENHYKKLRFTRGKINANY